MQRLAKSVRIFRRFNGREPREVRRLDLDLQTPLVEIGEVPEIHYLSDKEGRGRVHYRHEVDKPGKLYAHPQGKYFLLVGGSTVVREWLTEKQANPRAVLSGSNMDRAVRAYAALAPERRREIRDVPAYLAAMAWKIQRARVKKHGHR